MPSRSTCLCRSTGQGRRPDVTLKEHHWLDGLAPCAPAAHDPGRLKGSPPPLMMHLQDGVSCLTQSTSRPCMCFSIQHATAKNISSYIPSSQLWLQEFNVFLCVLRARAQTQPDWSGNRKALKGCSEKRKWQPSSLWCRWGPKPAVEEEMEWIQVRASIGKTTTELFCLFLVLVFPRKWRIQWQSLTKYTGGYVFVCFKPPVVFFYSPLFPRSQNWFPGLITRHNINFFRKVLCRRNAIHLPFAFCGELANRHVFTFLMLKTALVLYVALFFNPASSTGPFTSGSILP